MLSDAGEVSSICFTPLVVGGEVELGAASVVEGGAFEPIAGM